MRRTKLEIVNDILIAINNSGGKIKPTRLLYKANLSYRKLIEYVNELRDKKMVLEKIIDNKRYYTITEKGIMFINEFKKIKEFSDSFGL